MKAEAERDFAEQLRASALEQRQQRSRVNMRRRGLRGGRQIAACAPQVGAERCGEAGWARGIGRCRLGAQGIEAVAGLDEGQAHFVDRDVGTCGPAQLLFSLSLYGEQR